MITVPHNEYGNYPNAPNQYGLYPFVNKDIARPNAEYFELVDYTLTEMEKRGMVAGFLPLWGWVVGGKYDYSVSDEDVVFYARWISERYRDRKNIVRISGGDTSADDKWMTLGRELKPADPQKLVTFHPSRWSTSSYHLYGDADWLDFHMTQTGHSPNLATTYQTVEYVYNNSSKPILNGEPAYEDIVMILPGQDPSKMSPHQIRKAIYWSLLAGGFAPTYGHVEIFQFSGAMPGQLYTFGADSYWMEALNAPGVNHISYLASLLRSVPWHTFVRRQNLIASDNPSGPSHIRASSSADQTRSFIYFPEQQTATIQLSELIGPLNVR